MDRHGRQARLSEVGPAGQARIAAASIEVRSTGFAGEVASRYLAGAGVGTLGVSEAAHASAASAVDPSLRVERTRAEPRPPMQAEPTSNDAESSLDAFDDPSAREVARGAWEALRALRLVLEAGRVAQVAS
jgi:hypothetical protein